jgi:hypothetical protein
MYTFLKLSEETNEFVEILYSEENFKAYDTSTSPAYKRWISDRFREKHIATYVANDDDDRNLKEVVTLVDGGCVFETLKGDIYFANELENGEITGLTPEQIKTIKQALDHRTTYGLRALSVESNE